MNDTIESLRAERDAALAACAEMRAAWDDSYQDLREVIDLREAEIARQHKTLGEITEWSHTFGAALNPPGADTYGEGKRDAKDEVAAILRRMG